MYSQCQFQNIYEAAWNHAKTKGGKMKSTNSIFWYFSYLLLQKLYTDKIQNFNTIQILQKKKLK